MDSHLFFDSALGKQEYFDLEDDEESVLRQYRQKPAGKVKTKKQQKNSNWK